MKLSRHLSLACLVIAPLALNASVKDISSEQEYEQIVSQGNPTLVEFAANWCGVCNRVKGAFEEISNDNEFANVNFVRVDIDQAQELRKKNGIVGVPSFLFIQNNSQLKESVGVKNLKSFNEDLRNDLRSTFDLAECSTCGTDENDSDDENESDDEA